MSAIVSALAFAGQAAPIREIQPLPDGTTNAVIRIFAGDKSEHKISPYLFGKFTEHLGENVYNGLDAQILRNSTFAEYPFWTGEMNPDGVTRFHSDNGRVIEGMKERAYRYGFPREDFPALETSYRDGLASFWMRAGKPENVRVSPDFTPIGARAQRVETDGAGQGIAQWAYLPLHRIREYEWEIYARSVTGDTLQLALTARDGTKPLATAEAKGLTSAWQTIRGKFRVADDASPADSYRLALTTTGRGHFVIGHVFLRPADHVHGYDADIVRHLKAQRIPILRWPGGNFVSGYHWEDGVGPVEQRPTRPNYAWGGVEPNTVGTAEFIALCREIGAEPMICVNAASAGPAEAVRWMEYCNGATNTPQGALRAAHGHPEPFNVHHWEIGNELWGRWQYHWTTPLGNVDRLRQFAPAMRAADPAGHFYACGAPILQSGYWNGPLIQEAGTEFSTITDHSLIGGDVSRAAEPLDLFRDYMLTPEILEQKWGALGDQMWKAGMKDPHLAVTELQIFAKIGDELKAGQTSRLTYGELVRPSTQAEAMYDALIYHAAIRLAPFVSVITHSATVNHGGGLYKRREKVYIQPCYYTQAGFADFGNATPVRLQIAAAMEKAPFVLPDLREQNRDLKYSAVDALAAVTAKGELLVSLVNRTTGQALPVKIELQDFAAASTAEIYTVATEKPWSSHWMDESNTHKPTRTNLTISGSALELTLPPYSWTRLKIPARK